MHGDDGYLGGEGACALSVHGCAGGSACRLEGLPARVSARGGRRRACERAYASAVDVRAGAYVARRRESPYQFLEEATTGKTKASEARERPRERLLLR